MEISKGLFRWFVAVIAVALATAARVGLDPWLGQGIPFGFFFLGVVLTALYGGFGPALLASVLSTFAADYFVLEPRYTISYFHGTSETLSLVVFFGIAVVTSVLGYLLQLNREKASKALEVLRAAQVNAERAKAAAEEANAAKDQFLAVLSHELRTPLAPVLAGIQILQRSGELSEKALNNLEIIHRNVQLEARLIDDLLDLTRIVRGKLALERKAVNLCTALERVVEICKPDIEAKKLHFEIDLKGAPCRCRVYGDMSRLQQILWNLLKNSIKFTPVGGSVGIRCNRNNGTVVIEVNDSGIGIEPDFLPRLFNAFEQGEKHVTRQFGGLGLGLAISKRLVEMHGGTISATSAGRNQGATFCVSLPELPPETQTETETETETAPLVARNTSKHILLVEDHADTAMMMSALLESSGYCVETACDARQALESARDKEIDLLISDLGLPDKSGLELMKELAQQKKAPKGIALSGFGREEDVRRSKEAGFSEHLTKPVDFDVLLAAVERAF